jgi:Fe-S-cluster containining protein
MGKVPCEHCTALCCRYIALPIDTPKEPRDFDDIRWYLLHENISVFVEDGDWYICIQTRCRHLQADHRCQIYATRPRICRRYDFTNCDYHSGDYNWEHHFTCVEHLEEYLRQRRASRPGSNGSRRQTAWERRRVGNKRESGAANRSTEQPGTGSNGSLSTRLPPARILILHPPEAAS